MYCHNCGKEIENGVKHCPHCGAQQMAVQNDASSAQSSGSGKNSGKKKPVGLIAAVAIVAVVLVVAFVMLTGKRTLHVEDYVGLRVEGLSTEGTAAVSFDTDMLLAHIGEKKTLTEREKEEIEALIAGAMKDFSLSKSSQLANGDEVTITSNLDQKLLNDYKISLKNGSVVATVEGLTEIQEIHLNDYMKLEFSGFDGDGYAYIDMDYEKLRSDVEAQVRALAEPQEAEKFISEEMDKYLYSLFLVTNPSEGLKNGDEATASISMDYTEISEYGIRFTWENITETAEGLLPTYTVALTDYLDCAFSGYDGAGYADITLDTEKLAADLQAAFEEEGRGVYGALQEDTDMAADIANAADIIRSSWRSNFTTAADKESALVNGDTVTVDCTYEQDTLYIYQIGVYLEGGTKEFTAENLEEPQEVDLAEALTVNFSGICPNVCAELTIDYDQPYVSLTSLWDMNSREWILAKDGDVYEGEITYDEQEMLENGYRVTNSSYSYTISGLNTYELTAQSLEDETVAALSSELEEQVRTEIIRSSEGILDYTGDRWLIWNESRMALDSFKIAYQTDEDDTENRLYLVYHMAVPGRKLSRQEEQRDIFAVVRFYDIEQTPQGELVYTDNWNMPLYTTEQEVQDFIAQDIAEMENAKILAEDASEETLALELRDIPEILGGEVTDTQVQTGEFADNVKNQAACYLTYEEHIYARFDMNLTWSLANTFCQTAGGHLATVTSAREKAVIEKLLEDAPYSEYWLGATDADWEGGWQWVTGEPFEWTDWDSGQPDNSSYAEEGENHLEMGRGFGNRWNDNYGENTDGGFILEIEPAETADAGAGENAEMTEEADAAGAEAEVSASAYLAELTPSASYNSGIEEYLTDPYGNDHFYSLYLDASQSGSLVYDLDGGWSELTGTISTWTEAESDCFFEIAIWGDDNLLFSKYNYQKGDAPVPFAIDVKGVEKLYIQTKAYGSTYNGYLFLNEGQLTADGTEETLEETRKPLGELALISSAGYEKKESGTYTDIYGDIHRDAYMFSASENGCALWNLDGNYTSFDAVLFAADNYDGYGTAQAGLEILLDGECVFEVEDYSILGGALPVSLDVTGKKTLEVRTRGNEENGSLYFYLGDTMLGGIPAQAAETEETPEFPEIPAVVEQRAADIVTQGNYRYYLFEEPLTWEQAEAFCTSAGGVLACPTDADKNLALQYMVSAGLGDSYWIGGRLTKGVWGWSNGAEFGNYLNWGSGKPDNVDSLEFLLSMDYDGTWNDLPADATRGFIMETAAVSGQQAEDTVRLSALEWSESNYCEVLDVYDMDETLTKAKTLEIGSVRMDASNNAYFRVRLDGKYGTLTGTAEPYSEASENVNMQLAVFGDGKLLWELRNIRKSEEETAFSVDVSGVNVLTVASSNNGSYDYGHLYFTGALAAGEAAGETMQIQRLADLIQVSETGTNTENTLFTDDYGILHDRFLEMSAQENSSVLYNLARNYTTFTGTITAWTDGATETDALVQIQADGETLYEISGFDISEGPVAFEVDLTGKGTLEIAASSEDRTWIYVTDDELAVK
ncbi:NPCBM/NEW2 domain-containing protein [Marvinbryantia formatexigens]|nr:NPCBM/NEW2 domain-containing protein [Marvinbryantia formatexigens]UWO23478.1 NPCBM/NEW2 domain-containing protein [Marvinbryantia formatexigens DSM 14469]SDG57082.1 NPCBM/NEW2 domain-containing protein [Marvinbryantia formatexigens]